MAKVKPKNPKPCDKRSIDLGDCYYVKISTVAGGSCHPNLEIQFFSGDPARYLQEIRRQLPLGMGTRKGE